MIPIVSLIGKGGAGKTTLIEKLLRELCARGVRVAVVKHHAHTTPLDVPSKDTWRYAEAGASAVFVSSPAEIARFERVTHELTLAEITAQITDVDLILADGFKREPVPKIQVAQARVSTDLDVSPDELIAIASDYPTTLDIPSFDLNDAAGLANFICLYFSIETK